jgi:hypothetical protein
MAAFGLLMSHFEAFQKAQFAEIVNTLDLMDCVDDIDLAKRLEKEGCVISVLRVLSGRGDPREPGQIIADALGGWHNPSRVSNYFRSIFPRSNIYSNGAISELELMWQLRHSIVHTAGIVTREDAFKVRALRALKDRMLVLEDKFIVETGRRLHVLVKEATQLLEGEVRSVLQPAPRGEDNEGIVNAMVGCESTRQEWFSRPTTRSTRSRVKRAPG